MDEDREVSEDLVECVNTIIETAQDNIKKKMSEDHPARKNLRSKEQVLEHLQQGSN